MKNLKEIEGTCKQQGSTEFLSFSIRVRMHFDLGLKIIFTVKKVLCVLSHNTILSSCLTTLIARLCFILSLEILKLVSRQHQLLQRFLSVVAMYNFQVGVTYAVQVSEKHQSLHIFRASQQCRLAGVYLMQTTLQPQSIFQNPHHFLS